MRKGGKRNRLIIYLLYLAIATAAVSSVTLARYASTGAMGVSATVAAFAVGGSTEFDVLLEEGLYPGDTAEVDFTVTNFDGDVGCEVALEYDIKVTTTGNLPLQFTLVGEKSLTEGTVNDVLVEELTESEENVWTASGGQLPYAAAAEDRSTHSYKLLISWSETENDDDYSYEIDALQVTINAQQTDLTGETTE